MPIDVLMRAIYCLLLILCGVLAASGIVLRKRPDAASALGKLVPFQGILGVVLAIWSLVLAIRMLDFLAAYFMFSVLFACITTIVGVLLGVVLAYGLWATYVLNKNAPSAERGVSTSARFVAVQLPLGVAGIVFGIIYLVMILLVA